MAKHSVRDDADAQGCYRIDAVRTIFALQPDVGNDHSQHPFMHIDSRYPAAGNGAQWKEEMGALPLGVFQILAAEFSRMGGLPASADPIDGRNGLA